jgi:hypothetical protein
VKILNRLIMLAGLATLGVLLWKLSPQMVFGAIAPIGIMGAFSIAIFQILDHAINAVAWRFAFRPEAARRVPLFLLIRARIIGDSVNYLTPSGTIAGEFVRPALLGDSAPEEIKNASVVVAKLAQALAQAVFILVGFLFTAMAQLHLIDGRELWMALVGLGLVVALIILALFVLAREGAVPKFVQRIGVGWLDQVRKQMRGYLSKHPGRFALSTLGFTLGYGWGILEVFLICYFMGIEISPLKALAVETLSNAIDLAMFMVPAKIGTQEVGKAAIFRLLGYRASQGMAFGLIRHIRELLWAGGGFFYYAFVLKLPVRPIVSPNQQAPA